MSYKNQELFDRMVERLARRGWSRAMDHRHNRPVFGGPGSAVGGLFTPEVRAVLDEELARRGSKSGMLRDLLSPNMLFLGGPVRPEFYTKWGPVVRKRLFGRAAPIARYGPKAAFVGRIEGIHDDAPHLNTYYCQFAYTRNMEWKYDS